MKRKIFLTVAYFGLLTGFGLNIFNHLSASENKFASTIEPASVAPAEQLGKAFFIISEHIKPSVVSVFSESVIKIHRSDLPFGLGNDLLNNFFRDRLPSNEKSKPPHDLKIPRMGMGSGMILDHHGNILTNYHVIQNGEGLQVQFQNQKKVKAKVIGTDAKTDLAIIQVSAKEVETYPSVTFGNSDNVEVGDLVVAVGTPFGLTQSVTHGIISAKGRTDVGIGDYDDYLQTDTPINPGNSGGPLVNTRGEVIGMNSAIATSVGQSGGVGFAIPSNIIKTILPIVIKGEPVRRGELGVIIQNLTEDLASHFGLKNSNGVLVSQVNPNSPAERAGLKVEDVIIGYEGKPVDNIRALRILIAGVLPGTIVKLEVIRKLKQKTITVTVGGETVIAVQPPVEPKEEKTVLDRVGITIETFSQTSPGVAITSVEPGTPASGAGLLQGDLIIQIDHHSVKDSDDFMEHMSKNKSESFLFLIKRQGISIFVSVRYS